MGLWSPAHPSSCMAHFAHVSHPSLTRGSVTPALEILPNNIMSCGVWQDILVKSRLAEKGKSELGSLSCHLQAVTLDSLLNFAQHTFLHL